MSSPRISAFTTGMSRSAAIAARAKNDMKPSPMPCCFWKRSLCSARSAITSVMSISLKVVRIAAVRCAWTRRSAMRRRMGLIGTRSSPSARGADGVGAAGTSIRTGRALRSRYASTSSLVSRPPLPDAGTRVGSRSCSARRRRTAGLRGPTARAAAGAARAVGPLSPAVRRLLAEHDLDPTLVPASGKGGRLTKEDVLAYLERSARPVRIEVPAAPTPSAPLAEGEERVPMSPIRRRIAERLVQAQRTAAILTTFNEIDMSAVIALRAEHKERFQKQHGIGLGFMSFFARASIVALRDIPVVNAEIRGDDI